MARPTSRLLEIIEQLVLSIKDITTANGFVTNFNEQAVHIKPDRWASFNVFPYCYVTYEGGGINEMQTSHVKKTKIIELLFFLSNSTNKETIKQIADLETDLEYMFYTYNPRLKQDTTNKRLVSKIKILTDSVYKVANDRTTLYTVKLEVTYDTSWK